MNGVRSRKTVGGVAHDYVTQNGRVIQERYGTTVLQFVYGTDGNPYAMRYSENSGSTWQTFYYILNLQGDVVKLVDASGTVCAEYSYDAWGKCLSQTTAASCAVANLADRNPLRYRGYYYDTETGWYYLQSRYYDPIVKRFINADSYQDTDDGYLGLNMFAYCLNDPVNREDANGLWSWKKALKIVVGAVATAAAVAVTVATGGAAAPVLIGVATSTVSGAAVRAVSHRVATGSWAGAGKAALDGAVDGFMSGGLCALGGSVIGGAARTIKNARSGITIGKVGQFEDVAEIAKVRHYSGLKEFKLIEKTLGTKAAETVGWWQNKCVVKGVMALKGAIYDCGGALTGAYAKEVALTKGYQYLYNVWLM